MSGGDEAPILDRSIPKFSSAQYFCRKCKNPIYLSADIENLSEIDLSSVIREEFQSKYFPFNQSNRGQLSAFSISKYSSDDSYLSSVLPSCSSSSTSMDHHLQVSACLYDILCGRTIPDHPMCQECADSLITAHHQLLEFQQDELTSLQHFLSQLNVTIPIAPHLGDSSVEASLQESLSQSRESMNGDERDREAYKISPSSSELSRGGEEAGEGVSSHPDEPTPHQKRSSNMGDSFEERSLLVSAIEDEKWVSKVKESEAEYAKLKQELHHVLDEINFLDKQNTMDTLLLKQRQEKIDIETNAYNTQKLLLLEAEEELAILDARFRDARILYERLRRTNVLNIVFPIWYDGHIGIISGLHFGRLPSKPVEWSEINAAWGQCTFLLQCLATRLSYTYRNYLLVLMGNQSQITHLTTDKTYPLYNSTGGVRIFNTGKFDTGMCMFLECVHQLQCLIERPPEFILPYKILEKGRLQDADGQIYSIRLGQNTEENWTKCLKMLLVNLKWIIAACGRTNYYKT